MQLEERRRFHRAHVRKPAKVIFSPDDGLIDCIVLDLSIGGACLELASPAIIPEQFDLTFDSARTLRACRVAWRSGHKIGVAFV
jgi:hypothetical protein